MSRQTENNSIRRAACLGGDENGQGIVEFALLIPAFLLLSMILLDGGRAYFNNQVLLNAAREGARKGILSESSTADVDAAVAAVMSQAGYAAGGFSSNYANIGAAADPGTTTTVTVAISFTTLTGTFIPGWSGNIPMSQTIRMRHE